MCQGVQIPDANINDISNVRNSHACARVPALASRHVCRPSSQNARYNSQFSKNTNPASAPHPFQIFMCVRSSTARPGLVGLGGLEPPASPLSGVRSNHLSYRPKSRAWLVWWSLSGSNRRPPACKAGALPAELKPHCSNGTLPRYTLGVTGNC